jgi:hypothetical protein
MTKNITLNTKQLQCITKKKIIKWLHSFYTQEIKFNLLSVFIVLSICFYNVYSLPYSNK